MSVRFSQYLRESNEFITDHDKIQKIMLEITENVDRDSYSIREDGTVDTSVGLNLTTRLKKYGRIPIKFGTVNGSFTVDKNDLTSLKGSPTELTGSFGTFSCRFNKLKNLEYAPKSINGRFSCSDNPDLTSLKGIENTNGIRNMRCNHTSITSLEHLPACITILGCKCEHLTSLHNIHKILPNLQSIYISEKFEIKSHVLGLVMIKSLKMLSYASQSAAPRWLNIINDYAGKPDEVFKCQEELIDAGLDEYAQL